MGRKAANTQDISKPQSATIGGFIGMVRDVNSLTMEFSRGAHDLSPASYSCYEDNPFRHRRLELGRPFLYYWRARDDANHESASDKSHTSWMSTLFPTVFHHFAGEDPVDNLLYHWSDAPEKLCKREKGPVTGNPPPPRPGGPVTGRRGRGSKSGRTGVRPKPTPTSVVTGPGAKPNVPMGTNVFPCIRPPFDPQHRFPNDRKPIFKEEELAMPKLLAESGLVRRESYQNEVSLSIELMDRESLYKFREPALIADWRGSAVDGNLLNYDKNNPRLQTRIGKPAHAHSNVVWDIEDGSFEIDDERRGYISDVWKVRFNEKHKAMVAQNFGACQDDPCMGHALAANGAAQSYLSGTRGGPIHVIPNATKHIHGTSCQDGLVNPAYIKLGTAGGSLFHLTNDMAGPIVAAAGWKPGGGVVPKRCEMLWDSAAEHTIPTCLGTLVCKGAWKWTSWADITEPVPEEGDPLPDPYDYYGYDYEYDDPGPTKPSPPVTGRVNKASSTSASRIANLDPRGVGLDADADIDVTFRPRRVARSGVGRLPHRKNALPVPSMLMRELAVAGLRLIAAPPATVKPTGRPSTGSASPYVKQRDLPVLEAMGIDITSLRNDPSLDGSIWFDRYSAIPSAQNVINMLEAPTAPHFQAIAKVTTEGAWDLDGIGASIANPLGVNQDALAPTATAMMFLLPPNLGVGDTNLDPGGLTQVGLGLHSSACLDFGVPDFNTGLGCDGYRLQLNGATDVRELRFSPVAAGGSVGTPICMRPTSALGLASLTADPSTLTNGDMWYDTVTEKFRGRENGVSINLSEDSEGGGGASELDVTQPGHGFTTLGQQVYVDLSSGDWLLADWTDEEAESDGTISFVSGDDFTVTTGGIITGLSGLTPGQIYWGDETTPGAVTTTKPTGGGFFAQPVFKAVSATVAIVLRLPGRATGGVTSVQNFVDLGDTPGTITADTVYVGNPGGTALIASGMTGNAAGDMTVNSLTIDSGTLDLSGSEGTIVNVTEIAINLDDDPYDTDYFEFVVGDTDTGSGSPAQITINLPNITSGDIGKQITIEHRPSLGGEDCLLVDGDGADTISGLLTRLVCDECIVFTATSLTTWRAC